MKRPLIGVIPLFDEEKDSIWMLPGYMEALRMAGAIPLILPLQMTMEEFGQLKELLDGYLLTGGQDVSPELYKEKKRPLCGMACEARDTLEAMVYSHAVSADQPVLAICRGIQLMNVLEGGTLYQDLPTEFHGEPSVSHQMEPPYNRTVHAVTLSKDAPLFRLLGTETLLVNSYHHQGVRQKAAALSVMAVSQDGLVEGLYRKDKRFIWGIQWHPEFIYKEDKNQRKIVKEFVRACENEKSNCDDLP